MVETKTARITLNEEGILIVRINNGTHQSLADAKENLAMAVSESLDKRRPLLVDMRQAQALDADARHHYSGGTLERFTALGLLIEASPLGRMMGNVYLGVARPGIPTRLFTDEARAVDWLRGHR